MDQNEGRAVRQSTPPFAFFFLVLPYGISSGSSPLAALVCLIAGLVVLVLILNRSKA